MVSLLNKDGNPIGTPKKMPIETQNLVLKNIEASYKSNKYCIDIVTHAMKRVLNLVNVLEIQDNQLNKVRMDRIKFILKGLTEEPKYEREQIKTEKKKIEMSKP